MHPPGWQGDGEGERRSDLEEDEKAERPERRERRREKLEDRARRGWMLEAWARIEVAREIAEAKERKARRRRMEDDWRK